MKKIEENVRRHKREIRDPPDEEYARGNDRGVNIDNICVNIDRDNRYRNDRNNESDRNRGCQSSRDNDRVRGRDRDSDRVRGRDPDSDRERENNRTPWQSKHSNIALNKQVMSISDTREL